MTYAAWRRCAAALSLACLPITSVAQTSTSSLAATKPPPTRDSLNAISTRGHLLAEYDFVAALASDSVMARKPTAGAIESYIGRMRGTRWDFAFGRTSVSGDTFFVAYEVKQQTADPDKFDVVAYAPARADTGYYPRASRALALARKDFGTPRRPYNAAILERPNGLFWVYLMPGQLQQGIYPLGGDVRYLVSRDGRAIQAKRQLHNSIIENGPPARQGDGQLVASTHTAVVDDIPEDTDVFHVLVRVPQVPEYVVTDAFVYHIDVGGAVRLLGRRSEVLGQQPKAP